jgi:hypothetical protein
MDVASRKAGNRQSLACKPCRHPQRLLQTPVCRGQMPAAYKEW